ncbi:MAG: DUF420 domain-containing protein [Cyclobacteriaceae bacterium]
MNNKLYIRIIIVLSIVIPVAVAFLLFTPFDLGLSGEWIGSLPSLNAILNSSTAVCLVLAVIAVKKGNVKVHSGFMLTGLVLGCLFLISYVLYHSNTDAVKFGDLNHDSLVDAEELIKVGAMRTIYLFILLSHIGFSIVVVPFVLLAFYFALSDNIEKHKRIVKFTFPIWLYVSVTGVIVYLMISPYYI